MEKEKKEADFLKKYYKYHSMVESDDQGPEMAVNGNPEKTSNDVIDEKGNGQANIYDEDDWPVQVWQEKLFLF